MTPEPHSESGSFSAGQSGFSPEHTVPVLRQRYASMFRTMAVVAVLSYGSYLGVFLAFGVPVMPWVNLVATALCVLALWLIRRGHLAVASVVMAVVVLGQSVPATLVLGWNANFHLFAFLYLVFALLNPQLRLPGKVAIGAAVTAGYLLLESQAPQAGSVAPATLTLFKVLNVIMFAGTISFLALIYSTSIWTVTTRLHTLVAGERQARDNLQAIFANAPTALVLSRLQDGVLLDCNQHAVSLFEIPREAVSGQLAPDFWQRPEDRDRLKSLVKLSGRVDGFETELRTKSGRQFWAELSASAMTVDGTPSLLVGCIDISSRRRAEEALRRRHTLMRTLLDAAPTPMVVTRLGDSVLQYGNAPAAEMFEVPVEQMVGKTAPNFYAHPEHRASFLEAVRRDGRVDGFSTQLRTSSGRVFWALLSARLFDLEGEPAIIVGFVDLSAQKALEEQLRTLATTDGLTGAFNRRHFLELAETELGRAARHGHPLSIAMLDLDHFKSINDKHGHGAGDHVLSTFAGLVRELLRGFDVFGRVGGEEFAVLLPETAPGAAVEALERLRGAIEGHRFTLKPERAVTVSIGLASTRAGDSLTDVLKRADAALYGAKSGGRNRVVVDATANPGRSG